MDENTIRFILFFGLWVLSPCLSQEDHVVNERKSWTEAQRYCRETYTDLVTINSTEDMDKVKQHLGNNTDEFWIGLFGDDNNWKWSLEKDGFYEKGQADLRLWNTGEPNNPNQTFLCADTQPSNKWSDFVCDYKRPFVCYNDSASNYIYVKDVMNWTDAQWYCRSKYTDLASVRNMSENIAISQIVDHYAWIGMYKESWRWSDGQRLRMTSYSNWKAGQSVIVKNSCVTTTTTAWNIQPCSSTYPFICSRSPDIIQRQVVKLIVSKSGSSLDLEVNQDAILQQLTRSLQKHGLGEVKLKWRKQSDGKTFHLKKKEDTKKDMV
ncbi:hypothetical protein CHARACLAT_016486 [Characodon lateralis]|uniref:C-type lectin domain-containing protein n=1 Tax=Characodon lateralis TaxID=208331 RepID=A0ABU7DS17_9TELE|nr:hypothetical protein [Characodon lateralis]